MEALATYVSAIHQRPGTPSFTSETIEQSVWKDQGFEVRKEVTLYRFSNGVTIRREIEQDDFPSGAACAECWIIYEVLSNGCCDVQVDPPRKVFDNTCREAFWLTFHTS